MNQSESVTALLRLALLAARSKHDASFEVWVKLELEGYGWDGSACPDYRVVQGQPRAWNPYNGWIPLFFDDPEHANSVSRRPCGQSVPEIEKIASNPRPSPLHMPMSPEMEAELNRGSTFPIETQFTLFVPRTSLDHILNAVRNRVLEWTMQFDDEKQTMNEPEQDGSCFHDLLNDHVAVVKANGQRIREGVRAGVDSRKGEIIIFDVDLQLEEGDFFERRLPNGTLECYEIEDPGFQQGLEDIPASFQSRVRKVTGQSRDRGKQGSTTVNIYGHNARVNQGSMDQSTNTATDVTVNWTELRDVIKSNVADDSEREQLITSVVEMQESAGTPAFAARYKEFMSHAANHMTVLAPFLAPLAALL